MAKVDDRVMAMVEKEVKANRDVSTQDLYDKAKKINNSIGKLTLRQFNAIYPLQVKRRTAAPKRRKTGGRKRTRKATTTTGRDAVRQTLLDFAKEVVSAEGKAEVVDLISGVDKYVDRVLKAAGK